MPKYDEIFIERADLLKYQMYTLLARPRTQDVSIMDLATRLDWKYQSAYNVFQELLDDISELSQQEREDVRTQLLVAASLPVDLGEYRIYLAEHGMIYQLIDYMVEHPHPTLNQFLDQTYTSRSTLTRKVKVAKALFSQYQVRLKLASLSFTGNEYNIRACLYTIYWWVYRGGRWPFASVMQAEVSAEAEALSIGTDQPLEHLQQQYFLAICRLRAAERNRLATNHYLQRIEGLVQAQALRQDNTKRPLIGLDAAAFNFFQLSQPRFDRHVHNPKQAATEIMLLTDPTVSAVSDRISAALYAIDVAPLDDDLYLNLLRLIGGYVLVGGMFPQNQDCIDCDCGRVDTDLVALIQQALADLPEEAAYAGFFSEQAKFAEAAARLLLPAIPASRGGDDRLRVQLDVSPAEEGYQALSGFVGCVPWVAMVTAEDSDLIIAADDEVAPEESALPWCANALEFTGYQDVLIGTLIDAHDRKIQALSPVS